jgi:hypothetical protein
MEHELTLEISSKTLNQFRLEIPAGFFLFFIILIKRCKFFYF